MMHVESEIVPDSPPIAPSVAHLYRQSSALAVISVLAILFALKVAYALVVPILLGLILSYSFNPVVQLMTHLRLPRPFAAALLLLGIVSGVGSIAYDLRDEAAALVEAMPAAAHKLRLSIDQQSGHGPTAVIETMQKAATELERASGNNVGVGTSAPLGVTKVQIEKSKFNIKEYLWPGALGLGVAIGQISVVLFLTYFLLASGDSFRRKMVKIAGPGFGQKKLTLQALIEIDQQIQHYLLVQLFTSTLVGLITWLAFLWVGVDNAAVWGVVSFSLNFIPYIGSFVVAVSSALMAYVQFGGIDMGLLVGSMALLITSIEGWLLTPWLSGRACRMNSVAVFVGVLVSGWILGIWGLFLGVPILVAIKTVCDRIESLTPLGELLGE